MSAAPVPNSRSPVVSIALAVLCGVVLLRCANTPPAQPPSQDDGGGSTADAGTGGEDAGNPQDGGEEPKDAGAEDAGTEPDGGAPDFALGPSGCAAMTVEADVDLSGYRSDRFGWDDGACARRSAALVRNGAADPGGSRGGFLREFTYSVSGATRIARGTGANGWNGWGYVVNHYSSTADTSHGRTGTFRTLLGGPHHALHEFKVAMNPGGPVDVTIHWFFATGRDAPTYAITFDSSANAANAVRADTRAPYGDLAFEGVVGQIGGISWGDRRVFITTGSGPLTESSAWDYTAVNEVPFVRTWSQGVDAEMGAVQTEPFSRRPAGGDYGYGLLGQECWDRTSANQGAQCSTGSNVMPDDWLWPFQLNQYELPYTTSSHRLAWGSNYGAVGNTSVTAFGQTFSGYPYLSYAVFVVLGTHSSDATSRWVDEVERMSGAALTATEGTVRAQGTPGPGRTDTVAYAPAGYDPAYAVWVVEMSSGKATVTLDPIAGALSAPIFRFHGFTAAQPAQVTLDGVTLQSGTGYFATVDAQAQTLWLTLNATVTGPATLHVE